MSYSRKQPSQRYKELLRQYQAMHSLGDPEAHSSPEQTYTGHSTLAHAVEIKKYLEMTQSTSLLDYGSGKGIVYYKPVVQLPDQEKLVTLKQYWNTENITCYDPAYPPFEKLPEGKFDAVICIEVVEHIPEEDLSWVLKEIFEFSKKLVFISTSCFPARKHLPSGENAHCTVKPAKWWNAMISNIAEGYPEILWVLKCFKG